MTGGSRPPILRLHSDKASEFLTLTIKAYLSHQGVRQTVNSGHDPQGNGLAERWIGIVRFFLQTCAFLQTTGPTHADGLLTSTHTESQKSQSIRRYHILGMWL